MMKKNPDRAAAKHDLEYREESLKLPVAALVVVLLLVAAPLVWTILKIDDEGAKAIDISKYNLLIQTVDSDVQTVNAILANEASGLESKERKVTLIVPELVLVDEMKPTDSSLPLKINLKGIYWSPSNPLVDIDGETYYVGDKIQGYTLVKIDKTAVHFKDKDGKIVVKKFYENLF